MSWSYNPNNAVTSLVWANPRSLATTYGITFVFFSSAYLDVSVQRVCSPIGVTCLQHAGLPHSDICGSIRMCQSPQLFAAYHVLLRLWEPRHPPYALILLIVLVTYYLSLSNSCSFYFLNVFFISICQWTLIRLMGIGWWLMEKIQQLTTTNQQPIGGEYRSRTDDLLRARQAL